MIRIASGVTDQYVYFYAQTGLSGFTVYRSRNGAAWAAMTTPTISEGDSTNAPGVYQLLLDEDMTIGAGNFTEAMAFHVSADGMTPQVLHVELYSDRIGTPSDLGGGATLAANAADMAGATFDTATDSQEAIRDRGDAAWTTGAGEVRRI